MNTLDRQLADLRIYANELESKLQDDVSRKPAVPPQVPQSYSVRAACEPSYSGRLESRSTYSDLVPAKSSVVRARAPGAGLYTNVPPAPPVYSNLQRQLISSTYNVLRRPVSPPSQDCSTYGGSQSSAYESLYEPITPRACSQLSGTSLYASSASEPVPEPEDALYCGNCYCCGERIVGETTGCTAMERIYHIKCFCCQQCGINLQGRPFYAVSGKALCERDYWDTLEKCCVCGEPILDRILRATGKPYHPKCFTCVVCNQSLDGIPFTVDAVNRIHCIEDFHKRYAPRCARCREPIVPECGTEETVRIVALDRSYHVRCYSCEDCGDTLCSRVEGRGCYPLDGHLYCRGCNARRIQELSMNIE